jgi:O-antigen/teichoic acid export membrane protein
MRRLPSLTEGFGYAGLSYVSSVTIAIASGIVMARVYGIEVVGEFALVTAPVGALWYLSTVREQPAFVRAVARQEPRAGAVTGLFVAVFAFSSALTLVAVLLVTGATYVLYDTLIGQPGLFVPAIVNVAGYLVITNPTWNLDSIFVAFGDGRRLFWIRLQQSVVFLVLVVALSFALPTVWGPLLATIGSLVTALVHRLAAIGTWMPLRATRDEVRAGFRELPEIIKFGLKLAPGSIAAGFTTQSTIWVLGALTTVSTVGAYSRVSSLSSRFAEINGRLREMLFPALVRRRAAGDEEAFTRALVDSLRYVMVGLMLPAAVVGGASVSVMGLFGPEFEFAAAALAITMLNPALLGTNGMRVAATTAIDKPLSVTYARIAGLVVKLAAIVPLTVAWGLTGAAIASLVRPITVNVLLNLVVRKHLGLTPTQLFPHRQTVTVAAAYAAGFGAALLLQHLLLQPLGLALALLGGTAAYCGTYVALGGPTETDWRRFHAIVARLRRRLRPSAAEPARTTRPAGAGGQARATAAGIATATPQAEAVAEELP